MHLLKLPTTAILLLPNIDYVFFSLVFLYHPKLLSLSFYLQGYVFPFTRILKTLNIDPYLFLFLTNPLFFLSFSWKLHFIRNINIYHRFGVKNEFCVYLLSIRNLHRSGTHHKFESLTYTTLKLTQFKPSYLVVP